MSAYNCEKTIKESINSILNQSFQDFEFLIADDCSTDNTKALIESFSDNRIKLYPNSVNCHLVKTWNRLIGLARAPYVTFQDADDISYPDRLKILYNKIIEDQECAIVGANYYRPFNKWLQGIQSNFKLEYNDILNDIEQFKQINFYGTRSLFNKSILEAVGGFRNYFERVGWEDYDLFLRIAEQYKVCNVSDVLYEYRYYSTSSSKIKKTNISYKKVFIDEIGFFLHNQRKRTNGKDGLMEGGNEKELQLYFEQLNQLFLKDESLAYRKIAKNQISNKDYSNALKNTINALRLNSSELSNWALLRKLVAGFTRSCLKYVLIRLNVYKREN